MTAPPTPAITPVDSLPVHRATRGFVRLVPGVALVAVAVMFPGGGAGAQEPTTPTSAGTAPSTTTTAPAEPAEEQEAPQSVRGRIHLEGEGIEGIGIVLRSGGNELGADETDDNGEWEIPVAQAGTYVLELDTRTLPEDATLRNPAHESREVTVRQSQHRSILYPLGEGRRAAGGGASSVDQIIDLSALGIKIGLLVALTAVGLSLIYGVANLVNFAHGELVTFGALIAFFLNASGGGPGWPLVAAGAVAVAAGAAGGYLLETGMFAPLRRRRTEGISLIVFTIGLSLLIRHVFLVIMGASPRPYTDYTLQRAVDVGPISLPPKDFAIAGIAVVVLVAVALLLQRTRIGTGMRAVADNRMLAEASGINVEGVIRFTWILGGALAALGGVLLGVTEQVTWNMGFGLLLFMFAAVVVGGLGTAYGAMMGGLLVGIVSQVSTHWINPEFKDAVALAVLVLVLIVRPQGILGSRERVG